MTTTRAADENEGQTAGRPAAAGRMRCAGALALLLALPLAGCNTGPPDRPDPGTHFNIDLVAEEYVEPEKYLPRGAAAPAGLRSVVPGRAQPRSGGSLAPAPAAPVASPPLASATPDARAASELLRVHVLNVGTGSCQIVECPESSDILVADCGTMDPGPSDMTRDDIADYLLGIGATGDVMVTISHPHHNHYNRIPTLMGDRKAASIWLGGTFDGYGGEAPDRIDTWLDRQAAAGVQVYAGFPAGYANRGLPVDGLRCGAASTYILTVNVGDDPNGQSLMLLLEYGNFRIIFPGDADGRTQDRARETFGALTAGASVLIGSNHGAEVYGSNQRSWVEHVAPQTAVFSSGHAHRNPTKAAGEHYLATVLDDVREHAMWWDPRKDAANPSFRTTDAVYATAINGRILIESDGRSFTLSCGRGGECF